MKRALKTGACVLLGVMALPFLVGRALSAVDDSQFRTISVRNVFDLQTPPLPPVVTPPPPPMPNVKLVGIMTITGHPQAVIWSQEPGVPPKQPVTTVMVVDQREGDIHVLEIDPVGKSVRVQIDQNILSLKLEDKPTMSSPGPMANGLRAALPGSAAPGGYPQPASPNIIRKPPTSAANNYNQPAGYNPPPVYGSTPGGFSPAAANPANPAATMGLPTRPVRTDAPQAQLSPEEQMILIEAQRDTALKNRDPVAAILPPTPLGALMQQQAGATSTGTTGNPLPPVPTPRR